MATPFSAISANETGRHSTRALETLQRSTAYRQESLNDGSELRWLDDTRQQLLGVLLPDLTGGKNGVALILPDSSSAPLNQQLLTPLRQHLALTGWDTLSLFMPVEDPTDSPARSLPVMKALHKPASQAESTALSTAPASSASAETPAEAGQKDKTNENGDGEEVQESGAQQRSHEAFKPLPEPASYSEQLPSLIDAGLAQLEALRSEDNEISLIIGIGNSAADAAKTALDLQNARTPQEEGTQNLALIMVEPTHQSPSGRQLTELLAELKIPVLDLYFTQPGIPELSNPATQRRNQAKRNEQQNYFSTRIRSWPGNWQERSRWLIKTLDGQVRRHLLKDRQTSPAPDKTLKPFEAAPGSGV